jgi:hypothetical protein
MVNVASDAQAEALDECVDDGGQVTTRVLKSKAQNPAVFCRGCLVYQDVSDAEVKNNKEWSKASTRA